MTGRTQSRADRARVRDYIKSALNESAFCPGDRIPTERRLAEQFGITRNAVRRVLDDLEEEGLIIRHVGRGTFVKPSVIANGIDESGLALDRGASPAEYIEARLRFEPEMAWPVVSNATTADFDRMEDCLKRSESASARDEFELLDAEFHRLIVAGTNNKLLVEMYQMIHVVRHEQTMWGTLRQMGQVADQRMTFQNEHRAIFDALKRRDAELARALMVQHVRATRRRMLDY